MARIGLLSISRLVDYSPERLTYLIGRIFQEKHTVDILGSEAVSERIAESFELVTYHRRDFENTLVQRILIIPLTFLTAVRYVREHNPDVLASIGNLYINGLICAIVSRLWSTVSIVRVTNDLYDFHRHQETRTEQAMTFLKNNILGHLTIKLAHHIIVLGPAMKKELVDRGIDPEQIHIIPQPVRIQKETPPEGPINVRERFGIHPDTKLVLYVGRFWRYKGADRLAETIDRVTARSDDVEFLLVGTGGTFEDALIDQYGYHEDVHFAGWVEHPHLHYYFDAADVLFQPSRSEGLPNVILEAFHFGVPVVATDSGGEVAGYVSNLGSTTAELGDLLLKPEELVVDDIPVSAQDEENERRYQALIDEIIK